MLVYQRVQYVAVDLPLNWPLKAQFLACCFAATELDMGASQNREMAGQKKKNGISQPVTQLSNYIPTTWLDIVGCIAQFVVLIPHLSDHSITLVPLFGNSHVYLFYSFPFTLQCVQ